MTYTKGVQKGSANSGIFVKKNTKMKTEYLIIGAIAIVLIGVLVFFLSKKSSAKTRKEQQSGQTAPIQQPPFVPLTSRTPHNGQDDTHTLQAMLDGIPRSGGSLVIPSGKYFISDQLVLEQKPGTTVSISAASGAKIIATKPLKYMLWCKTTDNTRTKLILDGLVLDGEVTESERGSLLNGSFFGTGILVQKIEDLEIKNCKVSNIYGNGIMVGLERYKNASQLTAKDKAWIHDNIISNCSGLKRTYDNPANKTGARDNYGDGIRLTGGNGGLVENNTVENKLTEVRSVGRAGIVMEFNTINVTVKNNTIKGYDRGIHSESNQGGHTLSGNDISDCNMGIVITPGKVTDYLSNNPVTIENNTITDGIYDKEINGFVMHPMVQIFFYKSSPLMEGATVRGNTLKFTHNRGGSYYLLSGLNGLVVEGNNFISTKPKVGRILFNKPPASFTANKVENLLSVVSKNKDQIRSVKRNKVGNNVNYKL